MDKKYDEMTMVELKAELVKKQNELAEVYKVIKPLRESYVEDMTKYMTNIVNMDVKVDVIDSSSVRISIPGKSRQEITIRMETDYPDGYDAPAVKKVRMETWSAGNVHNGDTEKINYILLMGVIAKNLDDIFTKFTTTKVIKELDDAQSKGQSIRWEISKIDSAIRALERNAKREEVMKEIKVGTVIMTNKSRGYKSTITRMGKKCAFINDGGWRDSRYEIDDVVNRVVNGSWEIVK